MPSNEFKRAVRAYMAAHPGVSYAAAHRIVSTARVRAMVTVTAVSAGATMSCRWEIHVDDSRADAPFGGRHDAGVDETDDVEQWLDEVADTHGWRRAPGAVWPVGPTAEPVEVELERSDAGQRVDQALAVIEAAGLDHDRAHAPYLAAVAYELIRAGIEVEDWFANPDQPRDGAIELTVPLPGNAETFLAWREDEGWYYTRSKHGGGRADRTGDLLVGLAATPDDVAAAYLAATAHPRSPASPEQLDWQPPADYNPDAAPALDETSVSPDLEHALASYTTHPGWRVSFGPGRTGLEEFGEQVAHAFEGMAGVAPGSALEVSVQRLPDHRPLDQQRLSLTLTLTDQILDTPPARGTLAGLEWFSTEAASRWLAFLRYADGMVTRAGAATDAELPLAADQWNPRTVAATLAALLLYYGGATIAVRTALQQAIDDNAVHHAINQAVQDFAHAAEHARRYGQPGTATPRRKKVGELMTARCGISAGSWNPDRCPNQASHVLRVTADSTQALTVCAQHMAQLRPSFPHVLPIDGQTDVGQTQPQWTVGDRLWWVNQVTATHSTAHDIAVEVIAEPTQLCMVTMPTRPRTGLWQYRIQFTDRNGTVCQTWATEDTLAAKTPTAADR